MQFVYPGFLYYLLLIAIPIIIHLFNFRRFKKIYFSNVKFLEEIKEENKSKTNLKNILILITRILAIIFLVLTFAQPYIPNEIDKNKKIGDKGISIYIDNSFSMNTETEEGRLIDVVKEEVKKIVDQYQSTDQFQILTNDFEGRHQRMVQKEEFLNLLEEVNISPVSRPFSEVFNRQKDALNAFEGEEKRAFLFSDFQKNATDIKNIKNDSSISVRLFYNEAQASPNISIDSVWFKTPNRLYNQHEELLVRVRNYSDKKMENIPIKLEVNGQQKSLNAITIEANSYADSSLFFTNSSVGIQNGKISISDHPVTFDDDFYFSYNVDEVIRVLEILGEGVDSSNYFKSLFDEDEQYEFNLSTALNVDYSKLKGYNLIILSELENISSGLISELNEFINQGGSVVIFPGIKANITSYNIAFNQLKVNQIERLDTNNIKVANINLDNPLYQNVFEGIPENLDLPITFSHFKFEDIVRSRSENLLILQNGDPFFIKYQIKKGQFYLSSVPLDPKYSNFVKHALFVSTMLRIAESSSQSFKIYNVIGIDEHIKISSSDNSSTEVIEINKKDSEFSLTSEVLNMDGELKIPLLGQIRDAGIYEVLSQNKIISGAGFNFNRKESDLSLYNAEELQSEFNEYGLTNFAVIENTLRDSKIKVEDLLVEPIKLWKWCIIFVLLFLGLETVLLRLWK